MLTFDETITGTLDEIQPLLEARGYTAAMTGAGPIPLSDLDPYGMRRLGSPNIQTERWANHIYRGVLAFDEDGNAYLADAKRPTGKFVGGLFPLVVVKPDDSEGGINGADAGLECPECGTPLDTLGTCPCCWGGEADECAECGLPLDEFGECSCVFGCPVG